MQLTIGQKVAYPNQGVCLVEAYKEYTCGTRCISGYSLRVLNDNSTIFVPEEWHVEVRATPIMGGARDRRKGPRDAVPGAPRLVIRGLILLGGLDIRS